MICYLRMGFRWDVVLAGKNVSLMKIWMACFYRDYSSAIDEGAH
jgi:hypothetical protein